MGFASRIIIGPLLLTLLGIAPAGLGARLAALAAESHHAAHEHFIAQRTQTYERRTYTDRVETQGMRRISHRCQHAICRGNYFDGVRTFSLSYNDAAFPESDADNATTRTIRAIDSLAFAEPAFARAGGVVTDEPARGDALARYRVTAPAGHALIAAFDSATGRLAHIDDGESVIISYHDYRDVEGTWFAFERTSGAETFSYDRVTRSAAPLEGPRGLAIEATDATPLALEGSGPTPMFRCRLASIEFTCLLDTGTVGMAIGLRAAERLHLEPEGEIEVAGLGRYLSGLVHTGPLVLPGARIHDARFIVLPDFRAADIIVGGDALLSLRASIDYAHRTIAFSPAEKPVANTLAIAFRDFRPYVDVELGGERTALELDTGDDSAIDLGYAYFRTRPDLFLVETRGRTEGIGASTDRFGGTLHGVGVGPFRFESVAAVVTRTLRERGHLGAKLLERFTVTFDYAHERVELQPRRDTVGLPIR